MDGWPAKQDDFQAHYEPQPAKKPRGCFFYGCLTAVVLGVLGTLIVGVGIYAAYRYAKKFVADYAEEAPRAIPVVEMPAERLDDIKVRVERFEKGLDDKTPDLAPLEIRQDELNGLIAANEDLRGKLAVELVDGTAKGEVSLPLADIGFPGKYLNGTATFQVRIVDGKLVATIDSLVVKGQPVPDAFLTQLRGRNLVSDMKGNPELLRRIARLQRIEIKDGSVALHPKSPKDDDREGEGTPDDAAKPAPLIKPDEPPKPPAPPEEVVRP